MSAVTGLKLGSVPPSLEQRSTTSSVTDVAWVWAAQRLAIRRRGRVPPERPDVVGVMVSIPSRRIPGSGAEPSAEPPAKPG